MPAIYTPRLMYFDFDGNLTNPVSDGVRTRIDTFYGFGATQSGRVFVPIYAGSYDSSCNGGTDQDAIDAYQPAGRMWSYALPICSSVWDLHPMPSGGFAALYSVKYSDRHLLVVDADGNQVIDTAPAYLYNSSNESTAQSRIMVDLAGHILFTQAFQRDNGLRGREFDLYAGDGQSLLSSFSTDELGTDQNYSTSSTGIAIGQQRLYFSVGNVLHSIKFAELSMDYPRGALLGAVPISVGSLKYASLGDSYSSGESVEPFFDDSNVEGGDQCHRSKAAYSQLLDVDSRANIDSTVFVACSGATTHEITSDNTHNGEDAQDNHLSTDDNLVTISIGGNDIGFKELATACVQTPAVDCTLLPEAQQTSDALTDELPGALDSAFNAIKGKVGNNTLVYVVGYPQLIPDPNITMGNPYDCTYLSTSERFYLRAVVEQLDDTIRTAAWNHGFRYVDPESFFYGHEICQNGAYFNGVVPQPLVYSFHPNALGQRAYEEAIVTQMEQDGLAE